MSAMNQKEYLKKYLSIGSEPGKKKKKKKKIIQSDKFRIIDDDNDVRNFTKTVEEDLLGNEEDAPQVVGYIDDRPLELKLEDYKNTGMWKPAITNDNDVLIYESEESNNRHKKNAERILMEDIKQETVSPENSPRRNNVPLHDDISPPRRRPRRLDDDDLSPLRRRIEDNSPIHRNKSPPQNNKENDLSPSRAKMKLSFRIKTERVSPTRDDLSPSRRRNIKEEDLSPPRRDDRQDDLSPPRRRNRQGNLSPPRLLREYESRDSCTKRRPNRYNKSPLRGSKSDRRPTSPRSRKNYNRDNSPPRKSRRHDDSSSPPRRSKYYSKDISPIRRDNTRNTVSNRSESRNARLSPTNSRYSSRESRQDQNREPTEQISNVKLTSTLDGKRAGLQNAEELVKENQAFKKREDELFNKMSAQVSGVNAATIFRDKKTGRKRNLEEEAEREKEKQKKLIENKEKYDRWGKGLKQVEDYNEKIQQDVYEMSKPLARYADDDDLEKYLKEQEREGDPMLNYIRKKRNKERVQEGKPDKPQYEGEFMPNRYGIKPGHRWDGVNRSNGYEKKWFDVQNAKKASQEEIYKWSTEDM